MHIMSIGHLLDAAGKPTERAAQEQQGKGSA